MPQDPEEVGGLVCRRVYFVDGDEPSDAGVTEVPTGFFLVVAQVHGAAVGVTPI